MSGIKVSVFHGYAFNVKADALILKYGKTSYGLEKIVEREFNRLGASITEKLPIHVGEYFFTENKNITLTKNILFIGIEPMEDFGYKEIREYRKNALASLAKVGQRIETILMTIQGPLLGLDENEAFSCQIAGLLDSITNKNSPADLKEIIFVERSATTAAILQNVIQKLFTSGEIPLPDEAEVQQIAKNTTETLRSVGIQSESKKKIFVAMPFASSFDDCFHYGIQGAVNSFGYLCERADLNSFTGDVMEFVKERIANSDFVIADLTTANPNVYLEVGYA